jgi:hypothetical protein
MSREKRPSRHFVHNCRISTVRPSSEPAHLFFHPACARALTFQLANDRGKQQGVPIPAARPSLSSPRSQEPHRQVATAYGVPFNDIPGTSRDHRHGIVFLAASHVRCGIAWHHRWVLYMAGMISGRGWL